MDDENIRVKYSHCMDIVTNIFQTLSSPETGKPILDGLVEQHNIYSCEWKNQPDVWPKNIFSDDFEDFVEDLVCEEYGTNVDDFFHQVQVLPCFTLPTHTHNSYTHHTHTDHVGTVQN
jgi:hypothetical protein